MKYQIRTIHMTADKDTYGEGLSLNKYDTCYDYELTGDTPREIIDELKEHLDITDDHLVAIQGSHIHVNYTGIPVCDGTYREITDAEREQWKVGNLEAFDVYVTALVYKVEKAEHMACDGIENI